MLNQQGQVVKNFTKLLTNVILKFLSNYGKFTDIFAENINVFENILATTANEFVINKLVKLMML